jgi:hypothetical protein
MPSISMKPLVPSKPGPPKDPKSFWAPWPAIREPCAKRTINGADSFILEPLDLVAVIFTPFVASAGPSTSRGDEAKWLTRSYKLYTLDGSNKLPTSSCSYSPECVEGNSPNFA